MSSITYQFEYDVFHSIDELVPADANLLQKAREATIQAYAPYSQFHVGAAASLVNGLILTGSNQENASSPAGICAERVLLSAISALHPGIAVDSMAVSFNSELTRVDNPITPCGICRQTLQEYESRLNRPIRLLLSGKSGPVWVIPAAGMLLPLSFNNLNLARP
jgi:cytidine deaminase